jgi:hypothetical protein
MLFNPVENIWSAFPCINFAIFILSFHPGGSASTVSWDHFFESLQRYYGGMRRETPSAREMSGGAPFRPPPVRAITPQELEGLCAVLELTRTIAEQVWFMFSS